MPDPSARTKPSRSLSKGLDAWPGSLFRSVESARAAPKALNDILVTAASVPPVIIASASPRSKIS